MLGSIHFGVGAFLCIFILPCACKENKSLHEILFDRSYRFLSKLSVDKKKGVLYNKKHYR